MKTFPYQWQLDKLKIIFVENSSEGTKLFVDCFNEEFVIIHVNSGEEALEVFSRESDVAMVLTDHNLPGINGVDLLSRIYQQAPEVIRIIITAYIDISDTIDAINKGRIYQFILKPWDVVQMRMILGQAAQTWVLTKENTMLHDQVIEQNRLLLETNQQCQVSENNLRNLSTALLNAREDEQKRIAMELHDELGQSLAALKLQLRVMKNEFQDSDDVSNWLDSLRADINEIIENTRRISRNLSPVIIEDLGLDAALENIVQSFSRASGISCTFKPQSLQGLSSLDQQRLVYRLVQETLTNISKHAHATHIEFTIQVDENNVVMKITDNGTGFDVHRLDEQISGLKGIGMTAMVHRANMLGGSAKIDSTIGRGTAVCFTFPLNSGLI